jgi:hypothetical protein
MPEVAFEPTITASETAKTVHASDHSATVAGTLQTLPSKNNSEHIYYHLSKCEFTLKTQDGWL